MDYKGRGCSSSSNSSSISTISEEDIMELRKGPWTVDEDFKLINYISNHGEGRWNSLARCSGLKRSGKSCRLRWLNYLRPDVRRGNISLEEQLLILDLHSRWGNRWSKIAQHLPGRTDNEIKNYWRTRVQKHAKQLQCDVNSKQFKDTMRYVWIPRLIERIQANKANTTPSVDVGMMQQALQVTPPGASSGLADHNANPNPHYFHTQAGFRESSISPMGPGFDFQQALEANIPLMDGGDASDNLCNINVDDLWWSLQQQFNTIV